MAILNEGCFPQLYGALSFDLFLHLPILQKGHSLPWKRWKQFGKWLPGPETVTHWHLEYRGFQNNPTSTS